MSRKNGQPALPELRQGSRAGLLVRRGRVLTLAGVLAVAPMVTGIPQISSTAQAHPVKSRVHEVGFVKTSVAAMRSARDATGSVTRTPGVADPIITARAVAVTPVQDVARAVTVVGVTWPIKASPAKDTYQIRTLTGATWSRWQELGVADGGPDSTEAAGITTAGTSPYVVTGASKFEVRTLTADDMVSTAATVQVVDPGTSGADNVVQAPGAAAAATVRPIISTRSAWGADETLRQGKTPVYGQLKLGFVHHTAGSGTSADNSYSATEVPAMIRGMYAYHVQELGWDDIGYNFLIDRFGRTWEGRYGGMDRAVVGAQTLGYNSVSTGVAAIGNFDFAVVPPAVTVAFEQIFAWKFSLGGVPATGMSPVLGPDGITPLQRVVGHRDASATACPGTLLYGRLAEIRVGTDAIMARPPATGSVIRFAGADRYATSAAIVHASYQLGVPVAYIATGADFPDALAGGAAAARAGGPMLLVKRDVIPSQIRAELSRLKPASIVVLGGTGAVSAAVLKGLERYTTGPITRVAGANRYSTAATLARTFPHGSPVFLATGADYPDALAGTAAAAARQAAILLTGSSTLPPDTAAALSALAPSSITILGGTGAVSPAVATALQKYTPTTPTATRISGPNRYATAAAIASQVFPHPSGIFLTSGTGFADVLTGGPVAGASGQPLLLATRTCLPSPTAAVVSVSRPATVTLLGGSGALGSGVASLKTC